MNAALNQVKDQSMALIPNEMKDKEEDKDSKVNVEEIKKQQGIKEKEMNNNIFKPKYSFDIHDTITNNKQINTNANNNNFYQIYF